MYREPPTHNPCGVAFAAGFAVAICIGKANIAAAPSKIERIAVLCFRSIDPKVNEKGFHIIKRRQLEISVYTAVDPE